MRPAAALLAVLATASTALLGADPSLVVAGRDRTGVINPGLGTVSVFQPTTNALRLVGMVNWKDDLNQLLNTPLAGGPLDGPMNALRAGAEGTVPAPGAVIDELPDGARGQVGYRSLVREAEATFWGALPAFDGRVAGSFDGRYLYLAVPGPRALLVYEATGNDRDPLVLRSWTTYGPLLYVTGALRSKPEPQEMLSKLGVWGPKAQALLSGREPDADGRLKPAQAGDPWMAAIGGSAVIIDAANAKLMVYGMNGRSLRLVAARNLMADILAPGLNTFPTDQELVTRYVAANQAALAELGIQVIDPALCQAICDSALVGERASKVGVEAAVSGDLLTVDLPAARKVMVYQSRGDSGFDLVAVRDQAPSIAMAALTSYLNERVKARNLLNEASQLLGRKQDARAIETLAAALAIDATLASRVNTPTWERAGKRNPELARVLAQGAKDGEAQRAVVAKVLDAAQKLRDQQREAQAPAGNQAPAGK